MTKLDRCEEAVKILKDVLPHAFIGVKWGEDLLGNVHPYIEVDP